MPFEILLLGADDAQVLDRVAAGVFDHPICPALTSAFLRDPRHHLVVAAETGIVIGFVSAVHYLHPDKPAELWINEVGVAPSHQRRGVAKALLERMLKHARELGCVQAWVLTDPENAAARGLYRAAGGREVATRSVMVEFPLDER
ncbi:MAG TPA: GNAT family N-acetyltransferase [Lacunisphaera sp.]|nr:GNAT family N-acetyltransferase [Lacunisphaera sp.]